MVSLSKYNTKQNYICMLLTKEMVGTWVYNNLFISFCIYAVIELNKDEYEMNAVDKQHYTLSKLRCEDVVYAYC